MPIDSFKRVISKGLPTQLFMFVRLMLFWHEEIWVPWKAEKQNIPPFVEFPFQPKENPIWTKPEAEVNDTALSIVRFWL